MLAFYKSQQCSRGYQVRMVGKRLSGVAQIPGMSRRPRAACCSTGDFMIQEISRQSHRTLVADQVLECLAGNPIAWRDLFTAYHRYIYWFCCNFTNSHSD